MRIVAAILLLVLSSLACSKDWALPEVLPERKGTLLRAMCSGGPTQINESLALRVKGFETDTGTLIAVARGESISEEQQFTLRIPAIRTLAYHSGDLVVEALKEIARDSEEFDLNRNEAFLSLAKLGNEVGLQEVRRQFEEETASGRIRLATALCDFDRPECVPLLSETLETLAAEDAELLGQLIRKLYREGVLAGYEQLHELSRSRDPEIRQHVLEGIVLYRNIVKSQPEECRRVQQLFLSLADADDQELGALFLEFVPKFSSVTWEYEVYRAAVRGLQKQGPEGYLETQAINALENLRRLEESEPVRRNIQRRKEEMFRRIQQRQAEDAEGKGEGV